MDVCIFTSLSTWCVLWLSCSVLVVCEYTCHILVATWWHMYGPDWTKCNLGVSRPGICAISPGVWGVKLGLVTFKCTFLCWVGCVLRCVGLFVLCILGHSGTYMDLAPRTKCDLGVCRPWMCAFSQACPLGVWFGCLVLFWCCVRYLSFISWVMLAHVWTWLNKM